jgi:hypothetical protein
MPPRKRRHRHARVNLDEKFDLPTDTDPDDVLRRLLGVPGPVQLHEDQEKPDREDETEDS